MTARPCPMERCDAELTHDEEICRACAGRLRAQLRAVPALLDDLDDALARIGSSEPGEIRGAASGGCKPGCDHLPDNPSCVAGVRLDVNLAASEAAAQLRVVLHGWARVWAEQEPLPPTPDAQRRRDWHLGTAARQALLLAGQPLSGRPWAPDLAKEIADAFRAADRARDTPPDLTFVGRCSACSTPIYAVLGDAIARCQQCGARHDSADLHECALAGAKNAVESASVIARALLDPVTRKPLVTSSMIRGWKHRGALDVAEVNGRGQPLYRVADVAKLARDGADKAPG